MRLPFFVCCLKSQLPNEAKVLGEPPPNTLRVKSLYFMELRSNADLWRIFKRLSDEVIFREPDSSGKILV